MNKTSTRFVAGIQENKIAKLLDGQVCPNSGAGKWSKSDVRVLSASLSVECKTSMSNKDSFSIKKDWIKKHKEEAFSNRLQNTAIAISFNPDASENFFIIDSKLMVYLVDKLKEDYERDIL